MVNGLFSALLSTRSLEDRISSQVLCLGNLSADIMVRPVTEPGWGQTTWIDDLELNLGGNGASTAYTLAKLGCPVRLLGAIGDDPFGDYVLDQLRSAGVDIGGIQRLSSTATAASVALVHPDGNRALLHRPGASREVLPGAIDLSGHSHLHLANIFSLLRFQTQAHTLLREARERGIRTSMDTGWDPQGRWMATLAPCLPYTDWLIVNEDEARRLTGASEPEEAAAVLREQGARDVLIKLGPAGCLVSMGVECFRCAGFSVAVVDTTGAGDCFSGGFLAALQRGFDIRSAAQFANAVGALSVLGLGAVSGLLTFEETLQWIQVRSAPA